MRFKTKVTDREEFNNWVQETVQSANVLDEYEYARLLEPSEREIPRVYHSPANDTLFANLINKYAGGSHSHYGSPAHSTGGAH